MAVSIPSPQTTEDEKGNIILFLFQSHQLALEVLTIYLGNALVGEAVLHLSRCKGQGPVWETCKWCPSHAIHWEQLGRCEGPFPPPRVKITPSPHQQGSEVQSQISSTIAGLPALVPCSPLIAKREHLWCKQAEISLILGERSLLPECVYLSDDKIWGTHLWALPVVLNLPGGPDSGCEVREWKPITSPRPLASSPKSHLTPAVSGASSNSWRKRHYHLLW